MYRHWRFVHWLGSYISHFRDHQFECDDLAIRPITISFGLRFENQRSYLILDSEIAIASREPRELIGCRRSRNRLVWSSLPII